MKRIEHLVLIIALVVKFVVGDETKWDDCPFNHRLSRSFKLINEGSFVLECLNSTVPLSWAQPGGRQINVLVARIRPNTANPPVRAVWFFQGGPGFADEDIAEAFVHSEESRSLMGSGTELYFPDHRGTGYSATDFCCFSCPDDLFPKFVFFHPFKISKLQQGMSSI